MRPGRSGTRRILHAVASELAGEIVMTSEMPRFINGLTSNNMERFRALLARQRRWRAIGTLRIYDGEDDA